jgi:hypothetical protein
MTIIIILVIIGCAIAFGVWKYQQKRSADKTDKDKREAELLEQWKQGHSGFSGGGFWKRNK